MTTKKMKMSLMLKQILFKIYKKTFLQIINKIKNINILYGDLTTTLVPSIPSCSLIYVDEYLTYSKYIIYTIYIIQLCHTSVQCKCKIYIFHT